MNFLCFSLFTLQFLLNYYQASAHNYVEDNQPINKDAPLNIEACLKNETKCPMGIVSSPSISMKNATLTKPVSIKKRNYVSHRLVHHTFETGNADEHQYVRGTIQLTRRIKGLHARMNVWKPKVEADNEFSSSGIWLFAGEDKEINIIGVGWHVNPEVHPEDKREFTRFFGYWTIDGGETTGGYNGAEFISYNKNFYFGCQLHTSVYDDDKAQYNFLISIFEDEIVNRNERGWVVSINGQAIGYWPSIDFTRMNDSPIAVELVGQVRNVRSNHNRHTTTEMGSGYLEKDFKKSAYFSNLKVQYENGDIFSVSYEKLWIRESNDKYNCYKSLKFGKEEDEIEHGTGFFFGGSGYDPLLCP